MEDSLQSIADVKIPYATEGVIRTAQLDDTVAPTNSVQLAVNMNFDRVGAIQTRPGVTEFADDLVDAINNYGVLHNEVIQAGYNYISQLGLTSNVVPAGGFKDPAAVKVSSTKIAVFWSDGSSHGIAQNFGIDPVSGVVSALGTPITFDGTHAVGNAAIAINGSHVLNCWSGSGSLGYVQSFDVAGDSITADGSALNFDATKGQTFGLAQIDSTHFICFYTGTSFHGYATVFAVDGSFNVTQPGSALNFDSSATVSDNATAALGDGTHFVNVWTSTACFGQTFVVNTGTWAITAVGSPLNISGFGLSLNLLDVGDVEHMMLFFQDGSGSFTAQCLDVDPSTFAVTTVGTPATIYSGGGNDLNAVSFGDGEHFVAFYSKNVGDGFIQMIDLDPTTFDVTLIGSALTGFDFANGGYTASADLTTHQVIVVWGNPSAAKGEAAVINAYGNAVENRFLYAGSGTEVFNTAPGDAGVWVSRRSGLATVSKTRYTQFLNRIWMVNGNEQLGGNPVETSDGGDFDTTLVPEGFPKGDFIEGGFEGRVWVANKTLGVIYYTDIVQFTPPATYVLTYNPAVNFITQLTPQTGETITALQVVPRALLVFTENTILRIYGASSIDAYPAYNVGTFSQESIVTTKTGIFFHHSSGFYQFDYGSAPVEISRRIIDFVKAIPRANYHDITGVYDGFDNIEWSVGQVVVEGVVYTGCVVRYTISTQVWTIYDYKGINITANIFYDDGITLNHLMGTETGKTGAMDSGDTDFGNPFYYEFIDRWRSFTDMYYKTKRIDAVNVYNDNAAGANLMYQTQDQGANAWMQIGAVDGDTNSIIPNGNTQDFDVIRLRLTGFTKGPVIVVHGLEILQLTNKGQKKN